ncbi:alkylation response protein AidB-like acyl-CoA dehydrogenase [Actinocorallia herbida]|uniref:Alkylation response protein AidB-like acyl-CoA dehydrogenase n=1 Tax=Actinocorallia herbida TaxID=58109 RepID=A0A3N1CWY4_9ACTN|nr:acyl-CoA dehydrogenase family protein [Actinocorallia herbida]ROO85812.1 alkylation response protein AidB-like acyl-CoA dehydrogenase [Actinocorallia herbida]
MPAIFTPEQLDLERTLLALGEQGPVLARAGHEQGWREPSFESVLMEDYGLVGVPEEAGGVGSGLVDLAVAVEALGRRLVPTRFVAQAAAVQLGLAAGIDVSAAVEGGARWSPAVDEPGRDGFADPATDLVDGRVRGAKTLVAFPEGADALVVSLPGRTALVPAEGVLVRASLDPSRPYGAVSLDTEPLAVGPAGDGLLRGAVLVAADLCGVARGAIELGAAYARERRQFGRPIGAFQGVAFQLVEAFVGLKAAWDLTLYAAWAVQEGEADAAAHAHAAKARAGEAAVFAAERAIQVHGGMGITHEADPQLYLRRALATEPWFGAPSWHRRALGRIRLGG